MQNFAKNAKVELQWCKIFVCDFTFIICT